MDRWQGATSAYRDRQGKPLLVVMATLFLFCGLAGLALQQGWLW